MYIEINVAYSYYPLKGERVEGETSYTFRGNDVRDLDHRKMTRRIATWLKKKGANIAHGSLNVRPL